MLPKCGASQLAFDVFVESEKDMGEREEGEPSRLENCDANGAADEEHGHREGERTRVHLKLSMESCFETTSTIHSCLEEEARVRMKGEGRSKKKSAYLELGSSDGVHEGGDRPSNSYPQKDVHLDKKSF